MAEKVELLSPAGDLERLRMALHYGADAVYLAGREFGMRSSSVSFDDKSLITAVEETHAKGAKLYVTCNTLPREDELARLPDYLAFLQDVGVDALIIADLGVMKLAGRYAPRLERHVSTQLGVINSATANVLYDMGADTVVLARETPLEDIRRIRAETPKELRIECFVHGAMCVSFSGRCLLSNYLTGRDANRGQCAQPCRWKYHLVEEKRPGEYFEISEDGGTYIMNSRDLRMIEHLDELIEAGVGSFKIEGRTKSAYYAGVITNAYRHAINAVLRGEKPDPVWIEETEKVRHRPYSTGFFYGYPGQHVAASSYTSTYEVAAVVESCGADGSAVLTQRNRFSRGDELELLTNDGYPVPFIAGEMFDAEDNPLECARCAVMTIKMKLPRTAAQLSIVRKKRDEPQIS
ncbi:MAG: U32 family peptidase [Oscillospiraceae bacterium]|nr:U32 family peptidase [Oscillospiraceae bacterium]